MPEPHRFLVRVYYEDTDFSGVVYHASYLRFLERGRTELLRACGVAQADMRDEATGHPAGFVVRRLSLDFLKPARMDDLVTVVTRVSAIGGASLDLDQRVERSGLPLLTAAVRIALVSNGRARRLPRPLAEAIGRLVPSSSGESPASD